MPKDLGARIGMCRSVPRDTENCTERLEESVLRCESDATEAKQQSIECNQATSSLHAAVAEGAKREKALESSLKHMIEASEVRLQQGLSQAAHEREQISKALTDKTRELEQLIRSLDTRTQACEEACTKLSSNMRDEFRRFDDMGERISSSEAVVAQSKADNVSMQLLLKALEERLNEKVIHYMCCDSLYMMLSSRSSA